MRLLIVGTLKGQLTTATKIAMDKGASVTHASDDRAGAQRAALRPRRRPADGRRRARHPRPGAAARSRAHRGADRRLRHQQRRPRRGRRHPCRRQGIHPAAARSGADRGGAGRRRRRRARADLSRRDDGACGQARPADRAVRRLGADHRRVRHRQGGAGALRARPLEPRAGRRSSRSTARRSRRTCWSPSCSATRRAPSPARSRAASASSRRRPAARCCSTKSPRWTRGCRPSSCARSRSA